MKKTVILVVFLVGTFAVQAQEKDKQSLKDLLFSGKLKKDSTGVIRNTDDLSKKIDTSTKKETTPVNTAVPAANAQPDKNADITHTMTSDTAAVKLDTAVLAATGSANAAPAKSNTKLWKEYTDSLVKVLKDETLKSKQIKKNTYYIVVDYDLDVNGQVSVTNVTAEPESAFLQGQIRQIMDSTPLVLNPITDSNNKPKKVKRKQQFTITKE